MTTTAPESVWQPLCNARRGQGALVVVLVVSVIISAALVTAPSPSGRTAGVNPDAVGPLLAGSRVAIRGGDPFWAFELADRLTADGAELGAVEPTATPAEEEPTTTLIFYYERTHLDAARRIRAMLGLGTLRRRQVFQPNVDVTIVVGKDLSRL